MATWVGPIDSQTDPDAPLTAELGKRWDNNVIAAFEGDISAVKLRGDAVATITRGDLPILAVSAADTHIAAKSSFDYTLGAASTSSLSYVTAATYINFVYSGSMRFEARHRATDEGSTSYLRVYLNGVAQQTWTTNSTGGAVRSRDISISPGDVVEWRHQIGGPGSSIFSSDNAKADDVYQEVVPLGRASLL